MRTLTAEAPSFSPTASGTERLQADTPAYRRTARAMFCGGFATFAMLYGMQPLMPMFSAQFDISPASASGVMSSATTTLALCLIPASLIADRFGRKTVMNASLCIAALLTLLAAVVRDFHQLVVLRAIFGAVLAGLPAVAMAYLSEEIDPRTLGRAIGLYIAGNALGGMSGRLLTALLADWFSWRAATLAMGIGGLVAAWEFWRSLPESRHFRARPFEPTRLLREARGHLADQGLPWLFAAAFLLMGCFVSYYNYIGFQLGGPEFGLRTSVQGMVFTLYVFGIFSSAWAGTLADKLGRRRVMWIMVIVMGTGLALSLAATLWLMLPGVALFTFGFFGAHSVASSWVGRRAQTGKALASALYLCAYYLGSGLLGTATGLMWHVGGWHAIVALLGGLLALSFLIAMRLRRLEPLGAG